MEFRSGKKMRECALCAPHPLSEAFYFAGAFACLACGGAGLAVLAAGF